MTEHADPYEVIRAAAITFQPPRRVRVSDGAAESLMIVQPGGYTGPWSATETPYMTEPMDMLASRRHEAVCFVGPARSGKTMGLLDGWMSHVITCDPGDMLVIQMTQDKAREYSKTRVDRAIRHSPAIRAMSTGSGQDDNTHDKMFRHGMWLRIGWPSASQLSSSDYRYVALTDYDRMPDNIDGEGSAFQLGVKRTQTFLSRGMCMVESSPGRDVIDPAWQPATPHEAPPTNGILGIYNRGDRRRWYWPCPECGQLFQAAPGLDLFGLPKDSELVDMVRSADLNALAAEHAFLNCPHCAAKISPKQKQSMNMAGAWLRDGQTSPESDDGIQSSIASYWIGGVAAAYQSWHSIVLRYLQSLREYVMSGSEESLKTTINTDQAMPYTSRSMIESGASTTGKAERDLHRFMVPADARFLVAAIDVQGGTRGRFVVQVHAVGVGLEQWIVDRYEISNSERGEDVQIDPAGYPEDWDQITKRVIGSTYRLDDGREMRVMLTVVDSGGEDGVSTNAYAWYRRIRKAGLERYVMLVKGGSKKPESPVTRANARDPRGKPLRDVVLYLLDTDAFKDQVAAQRRRAVPGPGYMHIPGWLPQTWTDELNAERREKNGKWMQIRKRNESLDLWCYVLAACHKLGIAKLNWDNAPSWARPIDENSNVITPEERREAAKLKDGAINAPTKPTAAQPEQTIQAAVMPKPAPPRPASNPLLKSDWSNRL